MAISRSAISPIVIGRNRYLESVALLVGQARQGHGHTVVLAGEAGIGKSRLIAEIKASTRRDTLLVLQGNCFEPDRTLPFGPLVDLLRTLLATMSPATLLRFAEPYAAEMARVLPELAAVLPPGTPTRALSPEEEQRRLFEALIRLFSRLSARQPLLLVAEDIHWADDTSLGFFALLARRIAHLPILLLLSYRSDEQHPQLAHLLAQLDRERLATEIALAPLAPEQVEEMLRVIFHLNRRPRREFLDELNALTEGNPFFIEEVLHALMADEVIFYHDGAWDRKPLRDLNIPRSIQDTVRRRSAHLSPGARRAMVYAAVVGQRFEFALLQHLTGENEATLLDQLKELINTQLVVEQSAERFAFRHALTRQAVYAELLEREQRSIHRIIAGALETLYADELESHLSELAYHTCRADDWQRAFEYGRRAGERAQALYAPYAAVEQFTLAINTAALLKIPVPAILYRARANASETLGDFDSARSDLEAALHLAHEAGETVTEWETLLDLGLLWSGRDYSKTGDYYHRALDLVDTLDQPLKRARTLNRIANWHLNIDEPQTAKTLHSEALAIFESAGDERGMGETLDLLCMSSLLGGDLAGVTHYGRRAVPLLRTQDDRQPLASALITMSFGTAIRQSQALAVEPTTTRDAAESVEDGLRIAREIGWRAGEAEGLWVLSLCLNASGEFGRALETTAAALATAQDIEHRQWMTAARCAAGELAYELYALTQAREHLEQGLEQARATNSSHWIRVLTGILAATCLEQGDLAAAEAVLDAGLPPDTAMQTVGQRMAWVERGELALARQDPVAALDIAERLMETASPDEQQRMPLVATLRAKALLELRRYDEAESWLRSAETVLRAHGARTALRRVLGILAALAQARGDTEEMARYAAEAQTLTHQLAETIPDVVMRAVFLQQALASLPDTGTRTAEVAQAASAMLTAREREVAALVAQGKSNRAIAAELVISERTTESHISNILGKMGFSSRTQIATWAIDIGLARNNHRQPSHKTRSVDGH